jgi:hypothetical protein
VRPLRGWVDRGLPKLRTHTMSNDLGLGPRVRRLIEAGEAISINSPTSGEIVFLSKSFVRFTLPHSQTTQTTFRRVDGRLTATFGAPDHIGLPHGRWPRLILMYLTTQAVRTRSRVVQLDVSMKRFMRNFGIASTGGVNGSIKQFKDQLLRTASMSAAITETTEKRATLSNVPVADTYILTWESICDDSGTKQPATIHLGERVFEEMIKSAVPLDVRAVKALQQSPLSIDLYCWLTYRIHKVKRPTKIPLDSLNLQFGAAYTKPADFKRAFSAAMLEVACVYPKLKFELQDDSLLLMPSPTSVPSAT